jgi:hypothetical protein
MADAYLMLSDEGNSIRMHVEWGDRPMDTFDKESPAHRHMTLLMKAMDTIAQRAPDAEPIPTAITAARFAAAVADEEAKALTEGRAERMVPQV